ncbi:ERI1 exoribonuclease 2 isoform X2 [Eurytemora carolleeae]|uniref:ERI1 exoribonuclease 2 isoform X2 n=1 Tax=Eurytemora carolleeae TaxID=1294199 RepID=UPI000C7847DB|nr:ERI1 exoribonuclease 2 isoform X2 [Eurytemora carolleeae]|eukprot:XP_023327486.1 ERI1 exoribonuclease 2-like isoform X2 [Eurytemora affinis]
MEKTLELAEELGCIKYVKLDRTNKPIECSQEIKYLLIIDFESTCWQEKSSGFPPEIIEFPVLLVDLVTGETVSEFHEYVMPTEHPRLTSFCTQLTGINQETVESGIPLGTCLLLFNSWIKEMTEKYNLSSDSSTGNLYTCCTWSDWDLNLCLENECKRKQLKKPLELRRWIDIRAVYKQFYQRTPKGLKGGLKDVGLEFEGREHSGIEDARLVLSMVQSGCKLTETKSNPTLSSDLNNRKQQPSDRKYVPKIYLKENLNNIKILAPTRK